uniref:EGF-like domain-containing protein n=1 Tax=Panagrolaimus davidi TaxID=227884 RepID=A0A914Q2P0_9BILA
MNATNTSGACPLGFYGESCDIPDCNSLRNCSNAGYCIHPNICKCAPNYFGADCSQCSGWFCNQCDFFCVHGQCDAITKSCRCRKGWSGAACDICLYKNCSTEPMIKMILPQTAEWINENEYVYVHGTDLPKTDDMRYHCLFGGISTSGNWLSSELIRCSIPSRAKPGKHVFNVIPYGSKIYVPNENAKTVHFTFFIPCDQEKCQGFCFGPICLCKNFQSGQNCESTIQQLQNRTEELKDQSIIKSKEGELYIVQIPTQTSTAVMKVFSSISDLEMDPFKHTVTWKSPKGNISPYSIDVHLIDEKVDLNVKWNLEVEPNYTPLTGKVEKSGINNGYLLKGFIEYSNNSTNNQKTVPILLEILSSSNPNAILESFEISSTSSSSFSHLFYPFSSTKESETYTVRAKHPGKKNDTTNCATWTVKRLQVKPKKQSIKVENGTAIESYFTNAKAINCPNFDVRIIKPADIITVGSINLLKDKTIITYVTSNKAELPKITNVTIAFICDKFSGVTVKQQFLSADNTLADIEFFPKSLEFYTSTTNIPQYIMLKIQINSMPYSLDESLISDTNILPFYVAASNPPYLNNPTIYRIGMPSAFYPLNFGFYQISIQSFSFNPISEIFHLTPNNSNFEIYLNKKPTNQFVFNGKRIKSETIGGGDPTLPPSPEIIIEPSIFYSSNLNQNLFVNFIFKQSPSKNTTAVIEFGEQKEESEFFVERNVSMNEALKSSSGYRSQIRISRNAKYVSKIDYLPIYCNIVKQTVPFYYVVDGIEKDFVGSVDFIVDKRVSELDKAFICETESNHAAIPELTSIVYDCAAAKILECRAFYQPIQSCGAPWKSIPDDTISIHVYALFMNLKASCKLSDVDLKTVQALIECISSLDIDCPLAKPVQESETPTTPSPFNSLLTQMKTISSMTQSLHGFFPALSTLESQLIDFPNYMADFLHHFELTFPSSDFNNIRSQSWFDSFYSVISDNSELGPAITFSELETFQSWKDGKNLIFRWNETFEELKGEEFELISPESKESRILLIRKLIEKADKLKSLARQFAAKEPFTMLHDILATIFGRVDYTSSNATEVCAKAIGFVEPGKLRESEEFEVSIVITNVMDTQVLQNLRFQLEMLHSTPTGNYSFIKYRIGPLFYSGGIPSYLSPQKTLTVSWKIHPVFDRRLTEAVKEQPNVILTFDLNNKRKIQRIRIPEITILPDRHLRVYALAFSDVFPRTSESQPFSLSLHVMNSGFSTLKNLEFVEISPWLMDKQKQGNANFRINSVSIDSKFVGYLPKISIKEIQSGKTSIISINLTSLGGQSAKFKNCSVSVFVDGQNFPEHFDYKFFYVQEIVSSSTYILSDKEPQNYKANLFYFNPKSSQIRNLHQIQLVEEIPSEEQQESKSYYTILATFERLLSPEEMAEAASMEGLKQTESTIYGRIQYPENLKKEQKLVRVYEIGPGGIRRHLLDLNNTWIAKKGDVSELNFIDPQALPPALASQLSYEFIFAKSEDFNTPYFGQHFYREQIPENMIIQALTVIGKVGAHSPEGSKVNYSLVSQDKTENFVINTKTGKFDLF